MQSALRPYFTTGVAIVGASVIAVAPLSIPPAQDGLNIAAAVQSVSGDVQLTALADITGTFDALINATLAGIALSLDLEAAVDVNADVATNLANLTGALIEQITTAFGTDPLAALTEVLMLPVNVVSGLVTGLLGGLTGGTTDIFGGLLDLLTAPLGIITDLLGGLTGGADLGGLLDLLTVPLGIITGVIGDLFGGLVGGVGDVTPGGIVDTLAQLVVAPLRFGLTALQSANATFSGLLTGGIEVVSGALAEGLMGAGALAYNAITTGADFIGGLFGQAGGLLTNGAAALAGLLAPLAALPVVGPFVAAFGDVVAGFATAGATGLTGIGDAISGGGAVLAGLVEDLSTTLANVVTGGSGVLTGAIDSGSTAFGQVLQGFLNAINDIVPPPTTLAPAGGAATTMLAATRAAELAPTSVNSLVAPAATTVTLPADASVNAEAATSGTATVTLPPKASVNAEAATSGSGTVTVPGTSSPTAGTVTGTINTSTSTGADFGKDVSGAATGSTTGGSATASGKVTAKAKAKSGNAGASAQAKGNAKK